jgi:hypothetical protein
MQGGAPTHFSRAFQHVLSKTCHDRWVGRGGPTAWPPRTTPELNPLDFSMWKHLETLAYATPVNNEEALDSQNMWHAYSR